MERSKERLSSKTASHLSSLVFSLGLLAAPLIAVYPGHAQSGTRSDLAVESDVLKALANYPDISGENITATTKDGVVTLSGTAANGTAVGQAQVVAASVDGVRSVVNHVKVTGDSGQTAKAAMQKPSPAIEREPVQAQSTAPAESQPAAQAGSQGDWGQAGPPPDARDGKLPPPPQDNAQQADGYPIEDPGGQDQAVPNPAAQDPVNRSPAAQEPGNQAGQAGPPQQPNYPRPPYGRRNPRAYPPDRGYPEERANSYRVKLANAPLTVPERTLLTVRTSEPLDSRRLQGGEPFQAIVAQDIYEGEYLAIPRGAVLEGRVIGVKKPGAFAGGAGFALQVVSLNLGGHSYPVATDTFATDTQGKGGYTTANTISGAAIGAIIGGIAGRGPGAAIGAAAGGAAGAGASAATAGPREVMPPETLLTFHLREPLTVNPITYGEVQRLQASAQPPQQARPYRRPRPYGYPYAYGYPPPPPPPPYYYYRPYYYPYRYYYWR